MNESALNQESDEITSEPKLFGLPRPLAGALIGILFFLFLFFILNFWATKTRLLMAALFAPGFLTMIILSSSAINLSSIENTIAFFLTSSIPPAIIGSLIVSKENKRRANGIILLVIYILTSIALGLLILVVASIYN